MKTLVAVVVMAAGCWALSPALVAGHPSAGEYSERVTVDSGGMFDPDATLDTSRVIYSAPHRCAEDCGVED